MATLVKEPRGQATSLFPQAIETFSKGAAALAIVLYSCGFLIVSLHQSQYGFSDVNPFRPKVLVAGFWFAVFVAIPVLSVVPVKAALSWPRFAKLIPGYILFSLGFGVTLGNLFNFSSGTGTFLNWKWSLALAVLAMACLIAAGVKSAPQWVNVGAGILAGIYLISTAIGRMVVTHSFTFESIELWIFASVVVTHMEVMRLSNNRDALDWFRILLPSFAALATFALLYYPHLKSSVGGGSPVNVVVYFAKDSPIKPGQNTAAQLIDESDAGFYIVGPNEKRAMFVPRSAVSLVYFSDKVSDSVLLK